MPTRSARMTIAPLTPNRRSVVRPTQLRRTAQSLLKAKPARQAKATKGEGQKRVRAQSLDQAAQCSAASPAAARNVHISRGLLTQSSSGQADGGSEQEMAPKTPSIGPTHRRPDAALQEQEDGVLQSTRSVCRGDDEVGSEEILSAGSGVAPTGARDRCADLESQRRLR